MRMVCAGAKPSLRLASCCKVAVVNGGGGLRLAGLASILATVKAAVSSARLNASASAPVPMSRRCTLRPSAPTSLASNSSPRGVASVAISDQYSRGTNFSISSSRSQTSRSATDCTRPAGRAPEDRRERKSNQVVERTAGEIGVDQGAVDAARMLHGVEHCLLGDGVEHHPLDRLLLERVLLLEDFQHVPGNGLTLAIRVGGQDQLARALDRARDVVQPLLRLVVDFPKHAEVVLGIDRAVLGREVPHVTERGQDLVAGAKVFVDRLGLGRGLDNDDIHEAPIG